MKALQYIGEQEQEVDGQRAHERRHEEEEQEHDFFAADVAEKTGASATAGGRGAK
jgi:hypothetical protein